jgi:hypothetical protein
MARCVVITHRGPSMLPPCKAVWYPSDRLLWQPRVAGQPASMFSRRRMLWRLWRLERASTCVLDHRLAYAPDPFRMGDSYPLPLRCLLPQHHSLAEGSYRAPSPLARQQGSHYRQRREVRSYLRRQRVARHRSAPTCAAPSPTPPPSLLPLSLFDTGTPRSNRAR